MTPDEAMTQAIQSVPSLVRLDQAEQALAALLAWRDIDIEHGTHDDKGWTALQQLRDAADRIHLLTTEVGAAT